MSGQGIGSRAYFEHHYGSRDWRGYTNLLSIVSAHGGGGPIVDLGAGTGLLVEAATRSGFTCVGLEGSWDAIDIAISRVPSLRLVHHCLPDPFPLRGASVRSLILNQVIEHLDVRDASSVLDECSRVLQPGGILLVTSPSRFNRREWRADPTHIHLYAPSELRTLLGTKGFERIVSMDHPLALLGSSRLARALMRAVFTISRWERLSASASCYGFKPMPRSEPA